MSDLKPWPEFRTDNPDERSVLLDVGRAEMLINMLDLHDLAATDGRLFELIGAIFGASNGDPAVLSVAIEAFSNCIDDDALTRKIERLWKSFEDHAPEFDCIATLRKISTETPLTSASLIEAIFDDPSFDFVAFLNWHNS